MSHFYLTLPSNSSEKYYPNNTMTRFTTRLHSVIDLDGSWEVGLSEIIFTRSWPTISDFGTSFIVTCQYCPDVDSETDDHVMHAKIDIQGGYYEKVEHVIYAMNDAISKAFVKISLTEQLLRDGFEKEELWLIQNTKKRLHSKPWPKFEYHRIKNRLRVEMPSRMTVSFSNVLSNILGLSKNQNHLINNNDFPESFYGDRNCDVNVGINSLYVYCDILEHVPVGDTQSPLLRIVNAKGKPQETIHSIFDNPRFVPLRNKHFDSVEIDIRDCFGESISFEDGEVILVLEFRRALNPYLI